MAHWVKLCRQTDIDDEPRGFKVQELRIALYNVDGELYATSDVCTHAFALLSTGFQEGHIIECPLHNVTFDVRTGACLSRSYKNLETYPVRVENDEIYVELPDEQAAGAA